METNLVTKSNPTMDEVIENCLVYGDLKTLDAKGRISYYNAVCKSLALNPLTRPF